MANVEVILKEKIESLGAEADVVNVKAGYARNFLIPRGKAMEANRRNMRELEALQAIRAEREAQELADAEKTATRIRKARLNLTLATGQGGKAFGSITTMDLVEVLKEQAKVSLDRHQLQLDKPIKSTGRFDIPVKLHPDINVTLRVTVEAKGDQDEGASAEA